MIKPFDRFIPSRKIARSTSEMLNETYSHGLTILILTSFYEIIVCIKIQLATTWASYKIRKIAGCACAGNYGSVFPATDFQRKPLVSDPDMHHGTCVTHVPWCMSGSLTRSGGENVPGIPGACATRTFTYLVRGPCRKLLYGTYHRWTFVFNRM